MYPCVRRRGSPYNRWYIRHFARTIATNAHAKTRIKRGGELPWNFKIKYSQSIIKFSNLTSAFQCFFYYFFLCICIYFFFNPKMSIDCNGSNRHELAIRLITRMFSVVAWLFAHRCSVWVYLRVVNRRPVPIACAWPPIVKGLGIGVLMMVFSSALSGPVTGKSSYWHIVW